MEDLEKITLNGVTLTVIATVFDGEFDSNNNISHIEVLYLSDHHLYIRYSINNGDFTAITPLSKEVLPLRVFN